jgi:competence protein ComEC
MKKILFFLAITLCFSGFYIWRRWPDSQVHIFFCDVGQGDGILIVHRWYQIVIDGGPDNKMSDCLAEFMPLGDHTLEAMIATHADSDHTTGLIKLLQDYRVKTVFTEAYGKETITWEKFRTLVQQAVAGGTILKQPSAGETITFDQLLSGSIFSPTKKRGPLEVFSQHVSETKLSAIYSQEAQQFDAPNNEAIALFLTIQDIKIAFTSDLESSVELALISGHLLQDVDVLKAGHHGSKTSSSPAFLTLLRPEVAVISCSKNNTYGHPSPGVLAEYKKRGIKTFRTDQLGTIEMVTNGKKYWWRFHPSNRSK